MFTLIIPVYNEENSINSLFDKLSKIKDISKDIEIIIVDDCSSDNSYNYLKEKSKNLSIKLIKNEVNKGYGYSIKRAIKVSQTNTIAICDCDGTYPIEEVIKMFAIYKNESADMIIGKRNFEKNASSILKNFGRNIIGKIVNRLTEEKIPDFNSGLRIFDKNFLLENINIYPNGFSLTTTLTVLMKIDNRKVINYPIKYLPRIGKSKITASDFFRFLKLVFYLMFYFKPFKILLPINIIFLISFSISLVYDLLKFDLTEKTLLLLFISMNIMMSTFIVEIVLRKKK